MFDLATAFAVREREDGLLEKNTFDLGSAVPADSVISQPKPIVAPLEKPNWLLNTVNTVQSTIDKLFTIPGQEKSIPQITVESISHANDQVYTGRMRTGSWEEIPPDQVPYAQRSVGDQSKWEWQQSIPMWEAAIETGIQVFMVGYAGVETFKAGKTALGIRSLARNLDKSTQEFADTIIRTNSKDSLSAISKELNVSSKGFNELRTELMRRYQSAAISKLNSLEVVEGSQVKTAAQIEVEGKNFGKLLVEELGVLSKTLGTAGKTPAPFIKPVVGETVQFEKGGKLLTGVIESLVKNTAVINMGQGAEAIVIQNLAQLSKPPVAEVKQPTGEGQKPPVEPPPTAVSGEPQPDPIQELAKKREKLKGFIQSKRFVRVENLRKAIKLPKIEEMTESQLTDYETALAPFKEEDVFLSVRQIETVDNTDLKGIRTMREARERLAKEVGVPVEELSKIKTDELDRFRYDAALAEQNPLYELLVRETHKNFIGGDLKFINFENNLNTLTKKARASVKQGLVNKLIPTDDLIFEYMSSPNKDSIAKKMTSQELDLAVFLQKNFGDALEYLIRTEALKTGRENYITNVRRGMLEAIKQDGLVQAFKEMLDKQKQDEQTFNILDQSTDTILPLEKFFQFALQRTGNISPSQNVAKAASIYFKTLFKKQALDAIIPKMMIYVQSLTPTRMTPRGLEFDQSLKKFVKEWLNTKKGRKTSLLIKAGGKIDVATMGLKAFISIMDLGLNIPVGLAANVGESVASFVALGNKQTALGIKRFATKQGKNILKKYEGFVGRTVWKELIEPSKNIGDTFSATLFGLFNSSNVRSNKISLLGMMTPEEFKTGKISLDRLTEIRLDVARWRIQPGMKSIIEATTEGGILTQYKSWAIPILRTATADIANFIKKAGQGKAFNSKESVEILRALEITLAALALGSILADKKEDKSFIGQLRSKVRREALTIFGALDPQMILGIPRMFSWLGELGETLKQLIALETYKEKGRERELKGVTAAKKIITPRAVNSLIPKEKKSTSSSNDLISMPSLSLNLPNI